MSLTRLDVGRKHGAEASAERVRFETFSGDSREIH